MYLIIQENCFVLTHRETLKAKVYWHALKSTFMY